MLSLILFFVICISLDHVHAHMHHDHIHDHDHEFHSGLRSAQNVVGSATDPDGFRVSSENRCGTKEPSDAWKKESSRIVSKWISNKKLGLNDEATINVETYFHVIYDTEENNDSISDEKLQNQVDVLNDSFAPYGFSFSLKGTTRTKNLDWYDSAPQSSLDEDMKRALRVGGVATLNVYFKNTTVLGYATLPRGYSENPELDGVIIRAQTIPGGSTTRYNEGKTLVHEVGHWLGLLHTFPVVESFGCLLVGDQVADTPRHKSATRGCPVGKDTCPFFPGVDPIHNYMDYSDDICLTEFTTGQADRMFAMWNEYRASR